MTDTIDILASSDIGIPARILDLFVAQARMPTHFAFHAAGDVLLIRLGFGDLPPSRKSVMLTRLAAIAGVWKVAAAHDPAPLVAV